MTVGEPDRLARRSTTGSASGQARTGRTRARIAAATREARLRLQDVPDERRGSARRVGVGADVPEGDPAELVAAGGAARSVPAAVKEAASWSWRLLLIAAAIYLVVRLLTEVPIVTVPFVIALLLTVVLGPVQRLLRDRLRVPHSLAAFLALLAGIVVIGAIIWFVVFFTFGFVLIAALYAATASMVSRQEDVGSVTAPVMVLVMIPYFLVILFNDNALVLAIMSYVPFSAPVGMPMRMFLGTAEWWEPLLSLAILLVTTWGVVVLGSRIYSNSLLRMGGRVKIKEALSRRSAA